MSVCSGMSQAAQCLLGVLRLGQVTCLLSLIIQLIVDVLACLHMAAGVQVGAVAKGGVSPGGYDTPEVQHVTGIWLLPCPTHHRTPS